MASDILYGLSVWSALPDIVRKSRSMILLVLLKYSVTSWGYWAIM